jgi:hypothetical protein
MEESWKQKQRMGKLSVKKEAKVSKAVAFRKIERTELEP